MQAILPNKGALVEIKGMGVYVEQIDLFKDYCKILINGGYVTLPIGMIKISKDKKNVNINKESHGVGYHRQ